MRTSNSIILSFVIVCAFAPFSLALNVENATHELEGASGGSKLGNVIVEERNNCIHMNCKVSCINGSISSIVADIKEVFNRTNFDCPLLEELNIFYYEFPNGTLHRGFLGEYRTRVLRLYISMSNVTDIEAGAFADGNFLHLGFVELHLRSLRKDIFKGVSPNLKSISIVQNETLLSFVENNFLEYVEIRELKLQIGVNWLRNLTATNSSFNNLKILDFSRNNWSTALTPINFKHFYMLKELDLSHSLITYLPKYMFADLVGRLRRLDLSYNKLHTISHGVFGWRDIPSYMTILLNNNEWNCSCELSQEVEKIYNSRSAEISCSKPKIYENWSVLDKRFCEGNQSSTTIGQPQHEHTSVATGGDTKPTGNTSTSPQFMSGDVVSIECSRLPTIKDLFNGSVRWPRLQFELRESAMKVDVLIESENLSDPYGLIWFNKVTKQYYKMEVNYNEYGLGCYSSISGLTSVENLLADVDYTFCLIFKGQSTLSPFSCKSTNVAGERSDAARHAWLSTDMRLSGTLMVVLGIVIFLSIGILVIFLVIRRNPILLKGNKRVATTNAKNGEIVIFPTEKSMENFRRKEQMLSKENSRSTASHHRRTSIDSFESNGSYINSNVYEIIPSYLYFNGDVEKVYQNPPSIQPAAGIANSCPDSECYTEIPLPGKRMSNDPLPELPTHRTDYSEPVISVCTSIPEHPIPSGRLYT